MADDSDIADMIQYGIAQSEKVTDALNRVHSELLLHNQLEMALLAVTTVAMIIALTIAIACWMSLRRMHREIIDAEISRISDTGEIGSSLAYDLWVEQQAQLPESDRLFRHGYEIRGGGSPPTQP